MVVLRPPSFNVTTCSVRFFRRWLSGLAVLPACAATAHAAPSRAASHRAAPRPAVRCSYHVPGTRITRARRRSSSLTDCRAHRTSRSPGSLLLRSPSAAISRRIRGARPPPPSSAYTPPASAARAGGYLLCAAPPPRFPRCRAVLAGRLMPGAPPPGLALRLASPPRSDTVASSAEPPADLLTATRALFAPHRSSLPHDRPDASALEPPGRPGSSTAGGALDVGSLPLRQPAVSSTWRQHSALRRGPPARFRATSVFAIYEKIARHAAALKADSSARHGRPGVAQSLPTTARSPRSVRCLFRNPMHARGTRPPAGSSSTARAPSKFTSRASPRRHAAIRPAPSAGVHRRRTVRLAVASANRAATSAGHHHRRSGRPAARREIVGRIVPSRCLRTGANPRRPDRSRSTMRRTVRRALTLWTLRSRVGER